MASAIRSNKNKWLQEKAQDVLDLVAGCSCYPGPGLVYGQ